jgi:hypothetical protein
VLDPVSHTQPGLIDTHPTIPRKEAQIVMQPPLHNHNFEVHTDPVPAFDEPQFYPLNDEYGQGPGAENDMNAEQSCIKQIPSTYFQSFHMTGSRVPPTPTFVMWAGDNAGPSNGKKVKCRRCMICVQAGQEGYKCPGRIARSNCPLFS